MSAALATSEQTSLAAQDQLDARTRDEALAIKFLRALDNLIKPDTSPPHIEAIGEFLSTLPDISPKHLAQVLGEGTRVSGLPQAVNPLKKNFPASVQAALSTRYKL